MLSHYQVWFPNQTPSHLGLLQTLVGLILADPCGLVSCRCRSWGFHPSELFPAGELYQARHLAIPSRRFSGSRRIRPHPQGFLSVRSPYPRREYCIPWQTVALLGFIASTAFLRSGLDSSLDESSAHDLPFGALLARLRTGSSAYSLRCAWHLLLSQLPAALAFSAFFGIEPKLGVEVSATVRAAVSKIGRAHV